ncbi:glutamate--tRNA ligase, partial [Bittarella massiliensis]|nr:glutamate--tRNA ligase [Bittarella massiliensis (ex Durand et al. 2017)]
KVLPVLEGIEDFTLAPVHDALFALIAEVGVKNGAVLWPLRVALTGKSFTPGGGVEMAVILGREESLARIRKGIAQLQG